MRMVIILRRYFCCFRCISKYRPGISRLPHLRRSSIACEAHEQRWKQIAGQHACRLHASVQHLQHPPFPPGVGPRPLAAASTGVVTDQSAAPPEPLGLPLFRNLEGRLTDIAMDLFKRTMPGDNTDSWLHGLQRAASVEAVLELLSEAELAGAPRQARRLCAALLRLLQLRDSALTVAETAMDVHELPPPVWLHWPQMQLLLTQLRQLVHSCDHLELVCALYCLERLGVRGCDVTARQLSAEVAARLATFPLSALTALSVHYRFVAAGPGPLVPALLRALQRCQDSLSSWTELSWLVAAITCVNQYISQERTERFETFLHEFVGRTPATPDDADALLDIIQALVRGEVVEDNRLLVLRPLVSLYLRVQPQPPASALALLGHAVRAQAEASPPIESLLMQRASELVAGGSQHPELWRMVLRQSHWLPPPQLPDMLRRSLRRQMAALSAQLDTAGAPPLMFSDLRWTLLLTLQEPTRELHQQLWQICLAFLEQPSLTEAHRSVRFLASKYQQAALRSSGTAAAPALERALSRRLAAQLRSVQLPVVAAEEVARRGALLVTFCEREVPADLQNRLLALTHRDQLSSLRVTDLSRAVKVGRGRWQRGDSTLSSNYLHQLNALTIALNRWTLRHVPACTSIRSVGRLAEAVVMRRGAVIGNTAALDAVVKRLNQLLEMPTGRYGAVSSSVVDRMALCLSRVKFRDDTTLRYMCNHIVRCRDFVSRKTAMNVLQCVYSTGYLPAQEDAEFEQFLSATADLISRFLYVTPSYYVLRACQSLCLYGQLPPHLSRSVLSQAFLDKTEAEIRHWEGGFGNDEEVLRRNSIRRFQMEVNRTIRLNMPDQNLPWFSGDYAKGLPEPKPTARHEQLLSEVRATAEEVAGGRRMVRSRVRTDGYHFTADLVLLRRADRSFTDRDGPLVESVALLVPSISDYCINTPKLTGSQLLRKLHLELLGFTVRVVNPHHWNSMALADPKDKLSFLSALIDGTNLLEGES